jgi:hypothetical protein
VVPLDARCSNSTSPFELDVAFPLDLELDAGFPLDLELDAGFPLDLGT